MVQVSTEHVRLNAVDRDAFVAALGGVFENAPWVAERAHAMRPL
jgi:2-oxo-4-hydroxy-4-carboxy-5-ureidoimidazoline decarboxylase